MTRKLAYALTIIMTIVVICGIVLGVYLLKNRDDFTKNITLGDKTVEEEIDVSLSGFYPGSSQAYSVKFGGASVEGYKVSLGFDEDGDCTLAQFIVLTITLNGEKVTEDKLDKFIGGEGCSFALSSSENGGAELKLEYSMPEDVGNEAQGTVAEFVVTVTAEVGA